MSTKMIIIQQNDIIQFKHCQTLNVLMYKMKYEMMGRKELSFCSSTGGFRYSQSTFSKLM